MRGLAAALVATGERPSLAPLCPSQLPGLPFSFSLLPSSTPCWTDDEPSLTRIVVEGVVLHEQLGR